MSGDYNQTGKQIPTSQERLRARVHQKITLVKLPIACTQRRIFATTYTLLIEPPRTKTCRIARLCQRAEISLGLSIKSHCW